MRRKSLWLVLMVSSIILHFPCGLNAQTIKTGTVVPLEFEQAISSAVIHPGDTIHLSVVSDVLDPQTKEILIKQGTPAIGSITNVKKPDA